MSEHTESDKKLIAAVKAGDIAGAMEALAGGANPNTDASVRILEYKASLSDEAPVFVIACVTDDREMAELLLEHGAGIDGTCTRWLTYPFNDDPTPFEQATALTAVCELGNIPMANFLLERGARTEGGFMAGPTPLIEAAEHGHTELVAILLAHGANPNSWNGDSRTALYYAALNGHARIVQLLLSAGGAFRNEKQKEDVLKRVRQKGHREVEEMLKEG